MTFFQYLFCNQYAEISGRGGDGRKAQTNMLIMSTAIITLYIVLAIVAYGQLNPGVFEKKLALGSLNGKSVGQLLAVVTGLTVFFILKFFIGGKTWYDQSVEQFNGMLPEEQKRTSKKGLRYFFIAFVPVIIFIGWAMLSLF